MNTIKHTTFIFPQQTKVYQGKVRDMYTIDNKYIVSISTDRISAFDVILPRAIPFKGQILNQIATYFLEATKDIISNWLLFSPHPCVSIGYYCTPFPVEIIVRGYLSGHAWREYQNGKRYLCGVELPEGLKQNDKLPYPIITPTTKEFDGGHDIDISRELLLKKKVLSAETYDFISVKALALFERGSKMAKDNGLILLDTKYEFGQNHKGEILLIDEIHTPDSSRYFIKKEYETSPNPVSMSKEFVREWLMLQNFWGQEGQQIPFMDDEIIKTISQKYQDLYTIITANTFVPMFYKDYHIEILQSVNETLKKLNY